MLGYFKFVFVVYVNICLQLLLHDITSCENGYILVRLIIVILKRLHNLNKGSPRSLFRDCYHFGLIVIDIWFVEIMLLD